MVAEGLGITLLPDYSVADDPLERHGIITYRPLDADGPDVLLVAQHARTRYLSSPVRRLVRLLNGPSRAPAPRCLIERATWWRHRRERSRALRDIGRAPLLVDVLSPAHADRSAAGR